MKTTESINSVPRRPNRSESQLHANAPMMAPSRMLEATTCFQTAVMLNSSVSCKRAQEMTPVL